MKSHRQVICEKCQRIGEMRTAYGHFLCLYCAVDLEGWLATKISEPGSAPPEVAPASSVEHEVGAASDPGSVPPETNVLTRHTNRIFGRN